MTQAEFKPAEVAPQISNARSAIRILPLVIALGIAWHLYSKSPALPVAPGGPAIANDPRKITHLGVNITGTERFKHQVRQAVTLLHDQSPAAFKVLKKYVGLIQEGDRSGMWAQSDPPTFVMNGVTAYYSVTWCAGSIAHDSYHSALYHRHQEQHGSSVPQDAWTGQAAELRCIEHQLDVMRQISAPIHEIEHLKTMDGTHFDADGDGKSTWNDYLLRDW